MKHVLTSKEMGWVNVQSPTGEELAELVRDTDLELADAEFITQSHNRPEVTLRQSYILMLIHVPIFDRKLRVTKSAGLYFIIKKDKVYSLHYDPIVTLDAIRQGFESSTEKKDEYFGEDALSLCLYIITLLYDGAFHKLERLGKHVDIAEDAVFQGNERKMVEEISILTRDVMDFRKIVRPQKSLFTTIPQHEFVNAENASKWGRVRGQLLKMWDLLEGMVESVRELSNTNFTLLQHKENEILRLLTIYSIVVIPMLIVVDPYFTPGAVNAGMQDKIAFWVVLAILVTTLVIILAKLKRKRYR
jgi:magnesium transporter